MLLAGPRMSDFSNCCRLFVELQFSCRALPYGGGEERESKCRGANRSKVFAVNNAEPGFKRPWCVPRAERASQGRALSRSVIVEQRIKRVIFADQVNMAFPRRQIGSVSGRGAADPVCSNSVARLLRRFKSRTDGPRARMSGRGSRHVAETPMLELVPQSGSSEAQAFRGLLRCARNDGSRDCCAALAMAAPRPVRGRAPGHSMILFSGDSMMPRAPAS